MPFLTLEGPKPVKIFLDDLTELEPQAHAQLINTINLPWVEGMAVMPDVHFGKGATVGSVLICRDAVSPAVVGVDIGCGMMAVKTPYTSADMTDLGMLRHSIERAVPVGFQQNRAVSDRVGALMSSLGPASTFADPYMEKAALQLGTLGGGNHFIEICLDEHESVWVMLHSGSRHLGKSLADRHISAAKGLMADTVKRYGQEFDPDLACLLVDTMEYRAYLFDLMYSQQYALLNRQEMMLRVLRQLSYHLHGNDVGPQIMTHLMINCHHNYIEHQTDERGAFLVTRKGAVSAKEGEYGIIPGSMGAKSFIVKGKGSADSYCSCSHGAGRAMSRGAAKRKFSVEDFVKQTEGVECRKDVDVIDEIPGAYKDIDKVMANQSDLVEIVATLKQVLCVKG